MKRFLISGICGVIVACFTISGFAFETNANFALPTVTETSTENPFGNPIMPGADPQALVVGKTVWIYPTWNDGTRQSFFAFSSTDLKTWQRSGPVLDFKDVGWI